MYNVLVNDKMYIPTMYNKDTFSLYDKKKKIDNNGNFSIKYFL